MIKNALFQDDLFRRIVVFSTGLGLACMLGSLAAIRINQGQGLAFHWHWSILVIAAVAMVWNRQFWKVVLEAQDNMEAAQRSSGKMLLHLGILLALGIGSFLYPIRFIEQSHWNGILKGLLAAGIFLGTMFWLIYKCGKGFVEIDSTELKRQGQAGD